MSGTVASRIIGSWWQRLALITWMLVGGQLVVSAVETTTTFVSTNVGLRIPLQPGGGVNAITNSTVQVSGIQTAITRVTVSLYITHRWPADMRITLIPPAGPIGQIGVLLVDDQDIRSTQVLNPINPNFAPYSNRSSFTTGIGISALPAGRVVFSDGNPAIDPANITHVNNVENQVHLLPGIYAPAAALATFNTMAPSQSNGTWQLRIEDVFNGEDDGTLVYWSLSITEPGPHIWTGGGADDNWSTTLNWQAGNVPTTGEPSSLLIFPSTAVGSSINNIGEIRVVTMNVTGGYNFTATTTPNVGSITLIANSTLSVNSSTAVNLDMPMALVGQPTISVAGTGGLNLLGNITNDGAAAGMILVAGTSPMTISGNNGYTGITAISSGVIDITNNAALGGVGGGGTTVANGASLRVAAGLNLANETVSIQGPGVGGIGSLVFVGGTSILNRLTLVAGIPGTINILAGGVTVSNVTAAAPAAVHTLSVTNAGTLAINGALPASTALNLSGGATTFGAIQDNITTLSFSNGADLNVGARTTINGSISVGTSADPSIINGTELNLGGGGRIITVVGGTAGNGFETSTNSDLLISANITAGSFNKTGSGVLRTTGTNTGVGATISGGVLAASGALGSVNATNGVLSLAGTLNVGTTVNLANGTALILQQGIAPVMNAATVNLNGTAGVGGAVLQAYSGQGSTIITTTGAVTGTFNGQPDGVGIDYTANSVILDGLTGTLTFNPPGPFTVEENDGILQVTVQGTTGTAPLLRAFGQILEGRDVTLVGLTAVGTYVFDIPISDNFVDTGDLTGTLAIVPQDGARVTNSATLTIRDNDKSDAKSCGFGTGLTVFLLFGFGLLLHVRLRRP